MLSVTDRCRDGAVMEPSCASGARVCGQYCSLLEVWHCHQLSPREERLGVFRHWLTWRWSMPHYYFDIKDGHRLVDPSGLEFKNDDAAIAKAEGDRHRSFAR